LTDNAGMEKTKAAWLENVFWIKKQLLLRLLRASWSWSCHVRTFALRTSAPRTPAHRRPTKLCTTFGRLLGWCTTLYIHLGALAPWRNFSSCKIHFTSNSCVLLYCQCYCTALEQRRQPNFAAWYKEWNYGTFAEGATYIRLDGHHVGHRPTF